ncbi:MAG: tetratricopeptide repeat protein [Cyanobacteria bacterium P01_A01_bin.84]
MKTDYTELISLEEIEDFSGLFNPDELDDLAQNFKEMLTAYEELVPRFIETYVVETNSYDDYLNPKKRAKLANNYRKKEEDLERECLDFFQTEISNIKRAIEKAKLKKQWSSIIDICDSLITFYNVRTYWEDLEETLQTALNAAKKAKNELAVARIYNNIAHTFRLLGKAKDGISYGSNSYEIFCSLEDMQGEAESSYILGYLYRSVGNWEESIKSFEHCLSLFKYLKDFVGEAGALDGLGQVYTKQKNLDKAEKVLQESLKIKEEKVKDLFQTSITLNNLGKVYKNKEKLEEAKQLFERSLEIKNILGDNQGLGVCYNELGDVYRLMKNFEESWNQFQKSLDIKKKISASNSSKISDSHGEGLTLMNIGLWYQDRNEPEKAILYWRNALEKLNNYSPEFSQVDEWLWGKKISEPKDQLAKLADEDVLEFKKGNTKSLDC